MQTLHVKDNFNAEEAAHAAAEFVSSLDNLPGEVAFLLEEIKEKDLRINQLLSRINTRHFGLTKHARSSIKDKDKDPSSATGSSTPPFPLPLPPGTPLPTAHLSSKDAQALTKIASEFAKVQALQDEKIALAERMERITGRAKERGRAEWLKVGGMDLEEVEKLREGEESRGREEIAGGMVLLPSMGLGTGERPKKRKPHALPMAPTFHPPGHTIHPPPQHTAMLPPPAPHRGPGRRRNDRHQSSTSRFSEPDLPNAGASDADADGEEYDPDQDAEGEGEVDGDVGDDPRLYCICNQKSYGEMIGCDADDCAIEWYHVRCVGVTGALPEHWFCPSCVMRLGLTSSSGGRKEKKGRKAR